MADHEAYGQTVEVGLILRVAEAFRGAFGVGIDAHPGGEGNEAGVVNRSFRVAARVILQPIVPSRGDLNLVVTWALRQAALRRLDLSGVVARRADALLDSDSGLGDAWLAYLALAPDAVIDDLLVQAHEEG